MNWKTILQDAFNRNAHKIVRQEQIETLLEIQTGYSLTPKDRSNFEKATKDFEEAYDRAMCSKNDDELFAIVGDGSTGTYMHSQGKMGLYFHTRHIEFNSGYDVLFPTLPKNLAVKLAQAVATALDHAKDHSDELKSGALKPIGPIRSEFAKP